MIEWLAEAFFSGPVPAKRLPIDRSGTISRSLTARGQVPLTLGITTLTLEKAPLGIHDKTPEIEVGIVQSLLTERAENLCCILSFDPPPKGQDLSPPQRERLRQAQDLCRGAGASISGRAAQQEGSLRHSFRCQDVGIR